MKDEDCEDRAQEQLASLKRAMRKTMEDATVRAMHKVMAEFEAKSDQRLMEMPEKQPTHCKHKRENGGVCPHHNLQCGWPKCNEPEQPASKPLSGYINRAGINANDSPITVVEKLERVIEANNQETQRTWVGLTSEEIYACDEESGLPQHEITTGDLMAFARVIEAKLKEKNT